MKIKLKTKGMECYSCEQSIEAALREVEGVIGVKSDYVTESTTIEYDESKVDENTIRKKIESKGYIIGDGTPLSAKFGTFAIALGIFAIIIGIYLLFRNSINIDFNNISMETSFAALFILGFLTGFHCIGMCGGFVLSYAKNIKKTGDLLPHFLYGSGKTISYTVIGALFGLLGSFISFTIELRAGVAVLAGLFLVIYGLNMLNIFPILRKLQLRIPTPIPSRIKDKGPLVTGLLNGFMIACGPLQALYIFAAGTGSMVAGAQALFFFGLGTLAPLLTFGVASNFLSAAFSHNVVKFSGILVIILGLAMATNGLNLLGVGILPTNNVIGADDIQTNITIEDEYQVIKMEVTRYGWEPNSFVLKRGIPVRWEIDAKELNGCNNEIIVREYGLDIKLKQGLQVVEFTPEEEGIIRWSCWMGMIPGQFVVTDNVEITESGEINQDEVETPELPKGSTCSGSCGGSCTGGCGCGGTG
ncbi:sulfite exporter TauE/SafE family protein [Candidatus Micrarchaeota archaeon]|nr:sulfite exporter TauE/SafE family protein [Candidatus Micrarchaeota archaeon]